MTTNEYLGTPADKQLIVLLRSKSWQEAMNEIWVRSWAKSLGWKEKR